ncbi:hypothetical protein HS088_TW18G00015 [Tripterygium wilfordii]|uniref:60S ribosomal protein L18a n=1 Tax=Tripterygium wilfordii TaxID=458696 RepID=A0A7J7CB07_TRIWF|nr:hypothetical protein HS088_TW18G00015 [Tripterygium wilfordii]
MVAYRFHQYQVVGRALPTETDEHPNIFRMKLLATNEVCAKSKCWYYMRKQKKVKKSNGQVLAINECVGGTVEARTKFLALVNRFLDHPYRKGIVYLLNTTLRFF